MRSIFLPALIATMSCSCSAQPAPAGIAGVYRHSNHGDPQGGGALYVLENGRFAVTFFGGAVVGNWSINDNIVVFTPDIPEQGFVLYGRHNPLLKGRSRMFFSGFQSNKAYVSFSNAGAPTAMRPVFNEDANCVPFPNVDTLAQDVAAVSLAAIAYPATASDSQAIYTFDNRNSYNDFVAYYTPVRGDDAPFTAVWRRGGLYLDQHGSGGDFSERRPIQEEEEDMKFIRQIAAEHPAPDTVSYNPWYNDVGEGASVSMDEYRYDAAKNAYVSRRDYEEGEELKREDDGDRFNRMSIFYAFRRLKDFTVRQGIVKPAGKPVFDFSCKD